MPVRQAVHLTEDGRRNGMDEMSEKFREMGGEDYVAEE